MTITAFHSAKGGVGTTLLAAHTCALAKGLGMRVAGLAFDRTHELSDWLRSLDIARADGLQVEEVPRSADLATENAGASEA